MKIEKITICNLTSIEGKQVIDFTQEPLRSAGLFAITGDTGAGKSTILDAVCLALYNHAPRFENAERITGDDVKKTPTAHRPFRRPTCGAFSVAAAAKPSPLWSLPLLRGNAMRRNGLCGLSERTTTTRWCVACNASRPTRKPFQRRKSTAAFRKSSDWIIRSLRAPLCWRKIVLRISCVPGAARSRPCWRN